MAGPEGPNFNRCLVSFRVALRETNDVTVRHERVGTLVPLSLMIGQNTIMEKRVIEEDPRHAEPDCPETTARKVDKKAGEVVVGIDNYVKKRAV